MIRLHALTLHRPWAWSMTFGGKAIENRGWPPPGWLLGKHLALHAGKTWDQDGADFIRKIAPAMPGSSADHPLGIVAVVRVIGMMKDLGPVTFAADVQPEPEAAAKIMRELDMRWFFGPWGWICTDAVPILPVVPCRGMQGIWPVGDADLALVRERWKAARSPARSAHP